MESVQLDPIASQAAVPTIWTRGPTHELDLGAEGTAAALVDLSESELRAKLDEVYREGLSQLVTQADHGILINRVSYAMGQELGLCLQVVSSPANEVRAVNERLLVSALREQRAADEAKRSAQEIAALLDSMSESVTVFNAAGEVVLMNPASCRLFGFKETATTTHFARLDLRTQDDVALDFSKEILPRVLAGERMTNQEVLLHRDGEEAPRHLLVSMSPVRGANGHIESTIKVCRDVTEIRLLERMREDYVSLISHDLRGPLSAAKMGTDLIRTEPDEGRREKLHDRVRRNLDRMDRMIRDMLDAHLIRAGKSLPVIFEETDLVGIVRDVVEEVTTVHGDRFELSGESEIMGRFAPAALHRAFWNLLNNAVKYGDRQQVSVKIAIKDSSAHVSVHNEGSFIPAEEHARLFGLFTRAKTTEKGAPVRGWGLGLTLVKGTAEAHGGHVTLKSDQEHGTTFTMELPIAERH